MNLKYFLAIQFQNFNYSIHTKFLVLTLLLEKNRSPFNLKITVGLNDYFNLIKWNLVRWFANIFCLWKEWSKTHTFFMDVYVCSHDLLIVMILCLTYVLLNRSHRSLTILIFRICNSLLVNCYQIKKPRRQHFTKGDYAI